MAELAAATESVANALRATPPRDIRKTTLPNGMLVLTEQMPHLRSVALGVWVRSGSRDEHAEENGLSHFVEHMVFKGTENRSAQQLARDTDAIGGNLDAFTGKEAICFNVKVLDQNVPVAMDILSDLVLNPTFTPDDVKREQSVVLEEIKMDEDNPDYLVHEVHNANFWKGDPLARSILGTSRTVSSFQANQVRAFHTSRFAPENLIFSAAGNLQHEEMIALVSRYFSKLASAGQKGLVRFPAPTPTPHITLKHKASLEQVQLCLGVPAPPVDSPDRYILYMLNTILGGGMSSRLFQSVREEAGLAYSIYSELSPYRDTGALSVYAGTSGENAKQMIALIMGEFRRLKNEGVSTEELDRAKNQAKGNMVLGLESSAARMSNLARQEMYYGRFTSIDEIIQDVDRVQAGDIQRLAKNLLQSDHISLTLLGNLEGVTVTRDDLLC